MTDYIPNDPDCPKCGGGGFLRKSTRHANQRTCHCQHPKLAELDEEQPTRGVFVPSHARNTIAGPFPVTIAAPPQPITFRDDEGREWTLIKARVVPGEELFPDQQDATPDDLAGAGYVQLDEYNALLQRTGFVSPGRELEALRALAKHVRTQAVSGYWHATLIDLLEAVDEAREKKE